MGKSFSKRTEPKKESILYDLLAAGCFWHTMTFLSVKNQNFRHTAAAAPIFWSGRPDL